MTAHNNVGASIKVYSGNVPNVGAAGTLTGDAIDRLGYESCKLVAAAGVTTGSPSAFSVNSKLTECDTSGGQYADVTGAAITAITTDSTTAVVSVDLRACKRYLKVVTVVAHTDGSSPKTPVATTVVLGGASVQPVV